MKLLSILVILSSCTLGWGAREGFEGYSVGQEIGSQAQWLGNATVSDEESVEENQSLKIGLGQTASRKSEIQKGVVFWDFYILPVFDQGEAMLDVAGAQIGFRKSGSKGEVMAFSEDSPTAVPLDVPLLADSGEIENWLHFTIRVDRAKGVWDLYLDSKPVLTSLKLGAGSGLEVKGRPDACTYLDLVEERKTNPIFEDNDADGMPDAEEKALGLNPFVDDRDADIDGDGISNVAEFFSGTLAQGSGSAPSETSAYLFVDNLSGSDSYSGSQSYGAGGNGPKSSLKAAINAAPNGAVIVVLPGKGVYDEGSRGISGKRMTIKTQGNVTIK